MRMNIQKKESIDFLNELSACLDSRGVSKYYTCHCTGEGVFNYLKSHMSNLETIKTGSIIEI